MNNQKMVSQTLSRGTRAIRHAGASRVVRCIAVWSVLVIVVAAALLAIPYLWMVTAGVSTQGKAAPEQDTNTAPMGSLGRLRINLSHGAVHTIVYPRPGGAIVTAAPLELPSSQLRESDCGHVPAVSSIGLSALLPDMQPPSAPRWRSHSHNQLADDHLMIYVTVTSTLAEQGEVMREQQIPIAADQGRFHLGAEVYDRSLSSMDGHEIFKATGLDQRTGQPNMFDTTGSDIYVERDESAKALTVISCATFGDPQLRSSCVQQWSAQPADKALRFEAVYASSLLPVWREIRSKSESLLLSLGTTSCVEQGGTSRSLNR